MPTSGGAATINGIVYQMLWSLLQAQRMADATLQLESESVKSAVLILEPAGGGGDLRHTTGDVRIVEQLKARSTGQKWSLREVIEEVLPDLFKAIDVGCASEYRLVTESDRGDWADVERFFATLSETPPPDNVLDHLDDVQVIRFGRLQGGPWRLPTYTKRTLFEEIADVIHAKTLSLCPDVGESRRRTWHLLRRFRVWGGYTVDSVEEATIAWLDDVVPHREDVRSLRRQLAGALMDRVRQGRGTVTVRDLFAEAGVPIKALQGSAGALARAGRLAQTQCGRWGYTATGDVRRQEVEEMASTPSLGTISIIAGDGGVGKTWFACALCDALRESGSFAVLVKNEESASVTLVRLAEVMWCDIRGHDHRLALSSVCERLRAVAPRRYVVIDNVLTVEDASALTDRDWEAWGFRLVLVCPNDIVERVRATTRPTDVRHVEKFTTEQLRQYLGGHSAPWTGLPADVVDLIRRPVLASIYKRLSGGRNWIPHNEYEVFARAWQDGVCPVHGGPDLARRWARALFDGDAYPSSSSQLVRYGGGNAIRGLIASGWAREIEPDRFEFAHDRFLNWAIAESFAEALRTGSGDGVSTAVAELLVAPVRGGHHFGYVPMDLCWLLSRRKQLRSLDELIDLVAKRNGVRRELYRELLPTLGESGALAMVRHFKANPEDPGAVSDLVRGLLSLPRTVTNTISLEMLRDNQDNIVNAAMRLLANRPLVEAIDTLWSIHRNQPLSKSDDRGRWYARRIDRWSALRACVEQDLSWLKKRILAEGLDEPSLADLVDLVVQSPDGSSVWADVAEHVRASLPKVSPRTMISALRRFGNPADATWLSSQIESNEPFLAAAAIEALVACDVDEAMKVLESEERVLRCGPYSGWFACLLLKRAGATKFAIRELIKNSARPWEIAALYRNREHEIDPCTLGVLMGKLAPLVASVADTGTFPPEFYCAMALIEAANGADALDLFRELRDSRLAEDLVRLFRHQIVFRAECRFALKLLQRIGGPGYASVVAGMIGSEDANRATEGLSLAHTCVCSEVLCAVERRATDSAADGQTHHLQYEAVTALIRIGAWRPLFRAIVNVGMSMHPNAPLDLIELPPPSREDVEWLRGMNWPECPGLLMAWGLSRSPEYLGGLRGTFMAKPDDPDTTVAALYGLMANGDTSVETFEVFVAALSEANHAKNVAAWWLMNKGGDEGRAVLRRRLAERFDDAIAETLEQSPDDDKDVGQARWNRLREGRHSVFAETSLESLGALTESAALEYLELAAARTDGPMLGRRPAALRGLARRSKSLGFEATVAALRDAGDPSRWQYPDLLLEVDPVQARGVLLKVALEDESNAIRFAIGCALAREDLGDQVLVLLQGGSLRQVAVSSAIMAARRCNEQERAMLQRLAEGSIHEHRQMAQMALDCQSRMSQLVALAARYDVAGGLQEKSLLLDCALDICIPSHSRPLPVFHLWPFTKHVNRQDSEAISRRLSDALKRHRTEPLS